MSKLVVEVLDASELRVRGGEGLANAYAEVEFDDQIQRTHTRPRDLHPRWNEKLFFNLSNPMELQNKTINVVVYNHRPEGGHHENFLGRVRISGLMVPFSESEALIQRYPLEKRGLFSNIKGDLALRVYAINSGNSFNVEPQYGLDEMSQTPLEDDSVDKKRKKKEEKVLRTFHAIGAAAPAPEQAFKAHHQFTENVKNVKVRADFAQAAPPPPMMIQTRVPGQIPEFGLTETRPSLAARTRYYNLDKSSSTYDLVERMFFLYVSVVKAKDLPAMDVTGSLDPYVELKLGNYKGTTKHLEKNQNPTWNQTFAFSRERVQANLLEVTVKDKDIGKDDFVGRFVFDISEAPTRVPPDSPLAPQWYKLENKKGEKIKGEIMLAVWVGTQADEAFPEAWHSDAHNLSHQNLSNTRSKVYFSPKLYYLRLLVIEAQDLVPSDKTRGILDSYVKVQLGNQLRVTRPSQVKTVHPVFHEELMFVASEPFEDFLILSVDERLGPGKDKSLGRMSIPVRDIPQRIDTCKHPDPRWFNLFSSSGSEEKKEVKFASKICLRLCLESGYHVLDESTYFSSDFQPSSKFLRKPSIGILKLGILSAKNLLPMKMNEGKATDAYCVAKYGNKWVRTRTLIDTLHPRWNEQYTWEVHDPCTVITIGVFDNSHINGKDGARDQRIGKVRIRLSTLQTDRVYTHYYPLLVLQPSGLRKHGELHLAIKFTCTAWLNMVTQYGKPLLPKLHYVEPIQLRYIDLLRNHAMQIVAARLCRSEPPLRPEVVQYMLDQDYNMFSLRRSKANFYRAMSLLTGITGICKWCGNICYWKNPITTCLVFILFITLVCLPDLILPTVFLYLFLIGIWNYRFRPRSPPHMDARLSQAESAQLDELDEEFDLFPSSKPEEIVRKRYDRLRIVAGRAQTVVGDLATQAERVQGLLGWRDPRATAIFIFFALVFGVFIYVTPLQFILILVGVYMIRPPRFRRRTPSVQVNFFKRLPAKTDMLL
ncbi:hypothetical protein SAY86_011853 [Trapa natans]|uniref:C2 domain-containing protein n=1 Tax=Trapa natans TaxID=22666 RepID=A0AAN7LYY4_TRANT|nr:hypothetical protein SAY86_011853 [Trapa natans]